MGRGIFKKTSKWLLLGLLAIFLGFIFACSFYVFNLLRTGEWKKNIPITKISDSQTIDEKILSQITKNSYWVGSGKPQVTIIEFGDFSCPQCKIAFPTIREITAKYKNDVKLIFKDYPVISGNSGNLALAARCAGEQGFFWPMYDKLYINQGVGTKEELVELAKKTGADTTRFSACFDSKKYESEIQQDFQDGENLKVAGTPTWFINGNKVEGVPPHDTFVKMIESLLKK